jgi:hypothetical protein
MERVPAWAGLRVPGGGLDKMSKEMTGPAAVANYLEV